MNKPKLLFRGPCLSSSGYGVDSRQKLQALLDADKFDISVMCVNWGHTSFIYEDTPLIKKIKDLSIKYEENKRNGIIYDVSINCTIPSEFSKLARFNIGATAGIETDRVVPGWIQKTNENVDLVVVPSFHSARTFAEIQYHSNQDNSVLKLQKPIVVCPEGVDTKLFNLESVDSPLYKTKFNFSTKFNFLFVGLGLDKGFGEDRKNVSTLIKWFLETFKDNPDVGLVLKLSMVNNSMVDMNIVKERIQQIRNMVGIAGLPKIHLLHGRLADEEMAALYKHPDIKAMISLSRGEGFFLPGIEAAACGLPVMITNWSGHLDYLHIDGKKRFISFDYELKDIPQSQVCDWFEPGMKWAYVKEDDVKNKMRKIVLSYDTPKKWALELAKHINKHYSLEVVGSRFSALVDSFYQQAIAYHSEVSIDSSGAMTPEKLARKAKEQLGIKEGDKTLLYTMPLSAGDVYCSTAVVDSLKKKYPDHLIYFATGEQYSSILKNNPDIHKVIKWENWMASVPFCEKVFTEVFTPNLQIQLETSNWVRGGKGRKLAEEMANQCDVKLGEYKIDIEEPLEYPDGFMGGKSTKKTQSLPEKYIVLNPGSGKGQWEARNYTHWQEVVNNLKEMLKLPIVQVGLADDPLYEGCEDFRGKTNYNQLAYVVSKSKCVVGIDSLTSHLAAGFSVSQVSLYGSSYANSTGPVYSGIKNNGDPELQKMYENFKKWGKLEPEYVLLETSNRLGCEKACYRTSCEKDKDYPCINEIDPKEVVKAVCSLTNESFEYINIEDNTFDKSYKEYQPKISGYTTILNGIENDFPFMESVKSMLGFCDKVTVVDGGSTDGTYERLEKLAKADDRVQLLKREWDWNEPGMDGSMKAFARAMTDLGEGTFLWQQDCDEIVHEEDYEKIKKLVKRFPKDVDLMHFPQVELFGGDNFRTDRHLWKWHLSRSNFKITHGINKDARIMKDGKLYSKKGMSDGCEYINIMDHSFVAHKGFWTQELEVLRRTNPEQFGKKMNELYSELPKVYHYSWYDLKRKIIHFKKFWNTCWSNLYGDEKPEDRFPDVNLDNEESVNQKVKELLDRGGEHSKSKLFRLEHLHPAHMKDWLNRRK